MAGIAEVYLTDGLSPRKNCARRPKGDGMKRKGWAAFGTALFFFAAGSLVSAYLTRLNLARADSSRVFQLLVYHSVRGKVPPLEARFRDASGLMAKHGLDVIGFWVPNDKPAWNDTFVYLVAHSSREEAKKNWDTFHADPRFQEYVKAEEAEKLIDRVDSTYMRPTNFSSLR